MDVTRIQATQAVEEAHLAPQVIMGAPITHTMAKGAPKHPAELAELAAQQQLQAH